MDAAPLHALLLRQLKRAAIDPAACGPQWRTLLGRVSNAYRDTEQERYLLTRSQELASAEMTALYDALQHERDVLESRVLERTAALQASQGRLASLLSLSADWVWEQDAALKFSFVSDGLRSATGLEPAMLLGTQGLSALGNRADNGLAFERYAASVETHTPFRDLMLKVQRDDGNVCHLRLTGEPVFGDGGIFLGYRGVGTDVTQTTQAEERVRQLASFDSLTGLPNRKMFFDETAAALERAQRQNSQMALLFIDLDRFKNVNDSLGHLAGDKLLQVVAKRLGTVLRDDDLVARLGGDEFVAVIDGPLTPDTLKQLVQRVLKVISEPLYLNDRHFQVTASIGVSLFPDHGSDVTSLLQNADFAMYAAKAQGKDKGCLYTADLAMETPQQFSMEADLRQGIERDELVLHYQPKITLHDGKMNSVEALVRWQHPRQGLLYPAKFIDIAETTGLIVPIGRWVLKHVCAQLRTWCDAGLEVPRVAINLAAQQFGDDSLPDEVEQALQETQLPGTLLEVEITESALMANPERGCAILRRLRSLGVHVAIDDFGTGYSSLAYLKRFPAHTVKIDRSFIAGLPGDRDDLAITQAVIAMSHSLGLEVVAEGVETAEQLDVLRRLNCDHVQGYFFGKPVPPHLLTLQELPSPSRPSRAHAGDALTAQIAQLKASTTSAGA